MELLHVTLVDGKKKASAVAGQVTGFCNGRFANTGRVLMTNGGFFDTVETYDELLKLWADLPRSGK